MVVTITRGGYVKRTRSDHYRSQHRGGKGVRGAQLRADDVVEHFFVTTTHHWLLFFTDQGRVYRAKAYELQEAGARREGPARREPARAAAGRADRAGPRHPRLRGRARTWCSRPATAWSRRRRLTEYDTNRTGGIIAINLREGDELVSALLVDDRRRPAAGAAQGHVAPLHGRRRGAAPDGPRDLRRDRHALPADDELLAMMVARRDAFVVHRHRGRLREAHAVDQYRVQGRGGQGVSTAKLTDDRGGLVGALIVDAGDEVFAITSGGGVIRTRADEVRPTSRATMGVRLINLADGDTVVGITRNAESAAGVDDMDDAEVEGLIDADLAGGAAGRAADQAPSGDNGSDGETPDTRPRDGGSVSETQGDSPSDPVTDSAADPEQGDS